MSVVELLWTCHTETIRDLATNAPSRMRQYLTVTKDFGMLTQWDQQQLRDKASDKGGE